MKKEFTKVKDELELKIDRLLVQIEDCINNTSGLHNFVEKYVPLKT